MTPKQKRAIEELNKLPPASRKKVARQAMQLMAVRTASSSKAKPRQNH
jgi:hypothetical protein